MFLDQKIMFFCRFCGENNLPNNFAELGGGDHPAFLRKQIRKTVFQRLLLKDGNIKNATYMATATVLKKKTLDNMILLGI